MEEEKNKRELPICEKCKEAPTQVLTRGDSWCKECFLSMVHHKFKSLLARCKAADCQIRVDERVLICSSLGNSSRAMIHLAEKSIGMDERKRSFFKPSVLHIDYLDLLPISAEQAGDIRAKVEKALSVVTIPVDIVKIDSQTEEWVQWAGLDGDDRLRKCIDAVCMKYARENEFQKVLTGETATQSVIGILQKTVKGRGGEIPADVIPINKIDDKLAHVRPMREFHAFEVAKYCYYFVLDTVELPTFETKADVFSTLNKLTENFVLDLQEQQKNTVFTVLRASSKIRSKPGWEESEA